MMEHVPEYFFFHCYNPCTVTFFREGSKRVSIYEVWHSYEVYLERRIYCKGLLSCQNTTEQYLWLSDVAIFWANKANQCLKFRNFNPRVQKIMTDNAKVAIRSSYYDICGTKLKEAVYSLCVLALNLTAISSNHSCIFIPKKKKKWGSKTFFR